MLTYGRYAQLSAGLYLIAAQLHSNRCVLTALALLLQTLLRYWYKRTHADAAGGGSAEMARMSLKSMWKEVWKQVRCVEHVC
jgi:hypothetical protein